MQEQQAAEWRDGLLSSVKQAQALVEGLDDAAFNWKPAPDRWSMAQCYDHLNRVAIPLLPKIEAAMQKAEARQLYGAQEWRPGWLESKFLLAVGPNPPFKVEVPKMYVPAAEGRLREIVPEFTRLHSALADCVATAAKLDAKRIRISSPAMRLMSLSLGAWFAGTAIHVGYHLGQAAQVKAEAAFPAAR